MDIYLDKISKSHTDSNAHRLLFNNMDARFESGQFNVIIGKSGVGKSSLLNLISGIDLPDKGQIRMGDSNLSAMTDTQRTIFRRKHIGFIYQFFNLIPVLTVMENLTLISELDGKPKKAYLNRAQELLKTVGLFDRKNDYPDTLSGGEQQRIAVVRSLVNEPEIILADEPTGNLDLKTGRLVLELISELTIKNKNTLVMVTHSPEAVDYADQVFRVENQTLVLESSKLSR
ncbi:ABC-type transport system, ATP-binding protein [Desulforapulum autotrophicum HRM2]|uniref:ABC-type transport system, ATP-binding protein n=1 Tax=Desulforapulum autotrophicum (strain ATCC 43914 / DSM 3382 / VKM B-1955 / HRM2) TaxID=177437 RepID=C0QDT1_DESAH|nr:ABC-type transport system, ATP-binding protein [Desulforapulum autotrophicum HRM2]